MTLSALLLQSARKIESAMDPARLKGLSDAADLATEKANKLGSAAMHKKAAEAHDYAGSFYPPSSPEYQRHSDAATTHYVALENLKRAEKSARQGWRPIK